MMFLLNLAAAVGLLALGMGVAFLVWASRNQGAGQFLAMSFGYIITVLAVIGMLCVSYYGISYWAMGYFAHPMSSKMSMGQGAMHSQCMMKDGKGMGSMPKGEQMKSGMGDGQHMGNMPSEGHRMPGMGDDSSDTTSSEEMKHEH